MEKAAINSPSVSEHELRTRLEKVEAEKAQIERRVVALEQLGAVKVELGEEFDGIRELSYHLKHGGLTPFLADRAWWPGIDRHVLWLALGLAGLFVIGLALQELGII